MHFAEKSAEGLRSVQAAVMQYVFENTPINLVVQRRVQLEHSSHIVKVDVKATCLHFNP